MTGYENMVYTECFIGLTANEMFVVSNLTILNIVIKTKLVINFFFIFIHLFIRLNGGSTFWGHDASTVFGAQTLGCFWGHDASTVFGVQTLGYFGGHVA